MNIELPTKKGESNTNPPIEFKQLVIVGANGSGKTRFGTDIETRYPEITHRVSAQKSLNMPAHVSTKMNEIAQIEFHSGYYHPNIKSNNKFGSPYRWGENPNTHLLDDFNKLMVLLHSEEYKASLAYKEYGGEKPNTKLDRIQKIWEAILPKRKLIKNAGKIEAYPTEHSNTIYNASEMSDGERVIFYLAGEVVCAPQNSIIIIDEPEIHIHSSLIKPFFDSLENERSDCYFIYLTHHIDFAFTRQNAKKIWAKSYENDVWDYEILNENTPIPEQLYLDVLGSRKPILFLEGDNSSIDYELYEHVFADMTLKPIGSCEKVIQTVKAFNDEQDFHRIKSFGIIDRDRRLEADIIALNKKGIWVLDVAEAENLLLIEPIVKEVAKHMGKDEEDVFNQVRDNIITLFSSQIDQQILLHYKEVLKREYMALSNFKSDNIDNAISKWA